MAERTRWRKAGAGAAVSVLMVLAIWLAFTWPLPAFVFRGIPCSAHATDSHGPRKMIAGDHLQFLYDVWLAGDMLKGKTPLFLNPYEFNTGNDKERREVHSYFLPAPLFYLVGEAIGGRAFGWNLTGFASLLLTYVFTVLLLRRYTASAAGAWLFAAVAVLLPYRWITLLGGSPTGMGVMFIPLTFLGLDLAVREDRPWGGALAGLGVVLIYLADIHSAFFCMLAAPFWCVLAFLARAQFEWRRPRAYGVTVWALLPSLLGVALAAGMSLSVQSAVADAQPGGGAMWTLDEIKLYSPTWRGLWQWRGSGKTGMIYLGWVLPSLLAAGWLWALWRAIRNWRESLRSWLLLSVLAAGLVGVTALALGPYGPSGGIAFRAARKLIPNYAMVRQPTKVFCVMPTLLSVACVLAAGPLLAGRRRRAAASVCGAVLGLMAVEYGQQIHADVTLLDTEQGAYRAVAEDAKAQGKDPRALAAVLWPGNSHWSSLYEHYASLHRVRMVNGYRPVVPRGYHEDLFKRFESVNMGELADDQIDDLLRRGVDHVILHEDAFPEKVSAYPVGFTLKRLLNHPRLSLLKQDGRVWAFKILDAPQVRPEQAAGWSACLPARQWEAERCKLSGPPVMKAESASGGAYIQLLEVEGAALTAETRLTSTVDAPNQRWMLRLRGPGTILCRQEVGGKIVDERELAVESDSWTWKDLPLPKIDRYCTVALRMQGKEKIVDVDLVLLAAGEWRELEAGQSVEIPAPCFFHAGYTDPAADAVVLEADREPADAIFYGPNLPLAAGRYRMHFVFSSSSAAGTKLGEVTLRAGADAGGPFEVIAGDSCVGEFGVRENLPLRLDFRYARQGNLAIRKVVLLRN